MKIKETINVDVAVLGGGPGGYTAAFRASDLGCSVVLIELHKNIGGVCLNVGCIPSKTLSNVVHIMEKSMHAKKFGIEFQSPKIDINKLRNWKEEVINKLATGLLNLAKKRKVKIIRGVGEFVSDKQIKVKQENGENILINFRDAIIAAGSTNIKLPFFPEDERIIDSTKALELPDIPKDLLVIGGGAIGMELGSIYNGLGAKVSVVELADSLLAGVDKDIVKVLIKNYNKKFEKILLETKVTKIEAKKEGLLVFFEGKNAPAEPQVFSKVLLSIGRTPNGKLIGAENAGIDVDEKGFVKINSKMQTNISNIYAIGDIVGPPMLAHKAMYEGKIAAEVICGKKSNFDVRCIPAVAYTDPEVATVGITEDKAKEEGINYGKGIFPWIASGKSLTMDFSDGVTKIIFDKTSNKIIGASIIGPNAGDLISELALAIEMGVDANDLSLTIHPHPSLSETVCMATEVFEGTITDLYIDKNKN